MRFKVKEAELRFTVPTQSAIDNAAEQVANLCRNRIRELYEDVDSAMSRLELELSMMQQTNTAIRFLIAKKITDLSQKEGYPVLVVGEISGSIIAFLLGITSLNPLRPYYHCESEGHILCADMVWESLKSPKEPSFEMFIAEPVRPLLEQHLNAKFKYREAVEEILSERIPLHSFEMCEKIGQLAKKTGKVPRLDEFDNELYLQVIKNLIDGDLSSDLAEPLVESFIKELRSITFCNFYMLTRILGYINGSFLEKRTLKKLYDPKFFMLRDEFFEALVACGIPNDIAYDFAIRGVWSRDLRRDKYVHILGKYGTSQELKDYFKQVVNLWRASSCISRLQLECTLAWYQIHYLEYQVK